MINQRLVIDLKRESVTRKTWRYGHMIISVCC